MKKCSKCKRVRSESEFYADNAKPNKIRPACKICSDLSHSKYVKENSEKMEKTRRRRTFRSYGLTEEKFSEILASQAGVCAVCRKKLTSGLGCNIDHCHSSGQVRGLLCSLCNFGIGIFKDSPLLLRSAIRYLEQFSARAEKSNKQKQTKRK